MKNTNGVLDTEAFLSNYAGLEDVLEEAINSFIKLHPALLESIHDAIQRQDTKALQVASHSAKGAISNFFAEPARLLAWELEQLGASGQLTGAENVLDKLTKEVEKLCKVLEGLKPKRKAS